MRKEGAKPSFSTTYSEGLKVGYKWYDAEKKPVLFPFGFGLSYTKYSYSDLQVNPASGPGSGSGSATTVTFKITNTGKADGTEVAEVYAALPASAQEPPKRLVGFTRVKLAAGESKEVSISVEPKFLSIWDVTANGWKLVPGSYNFMVGGSSQDLPLTKAVPFN
jgi:beta-glucosidase